MTPYPEVYKATSVNTNEKPSVLFQPQKLREWLQDSVAIGADEMFTVLCNTHILLNCLQFTRSVFTGSVAGAVLHTDCYGGA
jgi:hypothetical protein